MQSSVKAALAAAAGLLAAGCASMPTGPTVAVMPGPYKPFEVFANDDLVCRNFAGSRIGNGSAQTPAASAAESAVVGTALGAAAGALIGGNSRGTGVGAGVGLLGGSLVGSGSAQQSGLSLQNQYDIAYEQCMYAKGNQVPGYGYSSNVKPPPSNPPPPQR